MDGCSWLFGCSRLWGDVQNYHHPIVWLFCGSGNWNSIYCFQRQHYGELIEGRFRLEVILQLDKIDSREVFWYTGCPICIIKKGSADDANTRETTNKRGVGAIDPASVEAYKSAPKDRGGRPRKEDPRQE